MRPGGRYLAAGVLAAAALAGPSPLVLLASHGSADVAPEVVTAFRDDAIDESSGAVVRGDRLFTVNDSGDGAHLYEVDLRTGETVGVTTFADEDPVDVEALARGGAGDVWIGDIGDNRRSRGSVRLFRVRPAAGGGTVPAATYDLTYPDGPHDAEALLAHPRTGRLLVVTKSVFRGGVVYRAPRRMSPGRTYQLQRLGRVPGIVTGGTFLPDGRHLLLRTYGEIAVYTYPGLERLAHAEVATQEQGEAVALGDDGRVYLTSEGQGSQVLVTDVPTKERASARPREDAATRGQEGGDAEESTVYHPEPWMGLGPWGLLGAVLAVALATGTALAVVRARVRAARRRGRRRP